MIVDAKVPLAAYLDACEATDDAERARISSRMHARCASTWRSSAPRATGSSSVYARYVVMFLPDEGFFRAAWEQDPIADRGRLFARRHRRVPHRRCSSSCSRSPRLAAGERRRGCARGPGARTRAVRADRSRWRAPDQDGEQPQGRRRRVQRHRRLTREALASSRARKLEGLRRLRQGDCRCSSQPVGSASSRARRRLQAELCRACRRAAGSSRDRRRLRSDLR